MSKLPENGKLILENETRPGHDDKINEKDDGGDEGEDADCQDCSILKIRQLVTMVRILIRS